MKISVLTASMVIGFCGFVHADTLVGEYEACISKELLDELTTAIVREDKFAWNHLMKNGCIVTQEGVRITVLDTTWTGEAKVRAYIGNDSVILWTYKENIKK